MMRRAVMGFVLSAFALLGRTTNAQLSEPGHLPATAREAARHFRPVGTQGTEEARAELAAALNRLDAFLRTGAPAKVVGWKKFLQWDELSSLTHEGGSASNSVVDQVLTKLKADHTGLELSQFTRLRDALSRYKMATAAVGDTRLEDEFTKRVEHLASQLETYAKDPEAGDAALNIGRTVAWLETNRQAPELVGAIRNAYGRPNFFGYASQRFAASGIEQNVDQLSGIRDNILGTDIHGTARLVGRTTLVLNENPTAASMNILLGGTAWSNSVGYNGPVTIYSTGATSVSGSKSIFMTAAGLSSYAARASCCTSSNI